METQPVTRRGYSIDEAGEIIGCRRTKIYALIRNGQLRAHKVGARTIVFSDSLNAFLDSVPAVEPRSATQR